MPLTALAGGAAALSMAGLPLTLGFVAKDGAYEALLHASNWFPWLLMLIVIVSIFLGLAGLLAGVSPFRGTTTPVNEAHDPVWSLWVPPLVLGLSGLVAGLAPCAAQRTALERRYCHGRRVHRCVAQLVARTHADAPAQRAHAFRRRVRVRRSQGRSNAHVEIPIRDRRSVQRCGLDPRCGQSC